VNLDLLRGAVLELREQGATVIFSTHDMHVAEQLCDTVFMIFRGRKVLDGSLAEIRRAHAANRLRLRLADGTPMPEGIPGVDGVAAGNDGCLLQLAPGHSPQQVLRWLVERAPVEHFEIVQPTLHDVFVSIAGAKAAGPEAADA
jgi:ABC-2 type transport system ATP-binding protein